MISGYAQMEEGKEALQLYTRMWQEGLIPNRRTFIGALKACSCFLAFDKGNDVDGNHVEDRCLEQVRAIHLDIVSVGFESDESVANMLVDLYAKSGSLVDARSVFEKMPHPDVVAWNAIILGYADRKEGDVALELYLRMQAEGLVPNERTLVAALKACSSLAGLEDGNTYDQKHGRKWCLEQVRGIHSAAVKAGYASDIYVGNILLDVYARCGSLVESRRVFDEMPQRNVVSWTAMILAYAHVEEGEVALALYKQMQHDGVSPDNRAFVGALKACSSLAALGNTVIKRDEVCVKTRSLPDVPVANMPVVAYGKCDSQLDARDSRCLDHVREIHADIVKRQLKSDAFVDTMLVDAYAKCGSLVDARLVFEKMRYRDIVAWNAMILGYAQLEAGDVALELYAHMKQEGLIPNERTLVSALKACSTLAALEESTQNDGRKSAKVRSLGQVRAIHSDIVRTGYESDVFVANMLVDVYAKCGNLVDARNVFQAMPHRDIVSWNAMILGYAQLEQGEEALQLYGQMQQQGVQANERTFIGGLKACGSVAGLEKGKEIHAQISECGLQATDMYVQNALIDMYGKCGSMVDAQQVFDALPKRDVVTWSALIAGYARQGESELVFQMLERMKQEGIQPNSLTLLSILTVCSHVGLVEKGVQLEAWNPW